jgi:hypothetical protein
MTAESEGNYSSRVNEEYGEPYDEYNQPNDQMIPSHQYNPPNAMPENEPLPDIERDPPGDQYNHNQEPIQE